MDLSNLKKELDKQAKQKRNVIPRLNATILREELVDWLADVKLPVGTDANSWDELISEFPAVADGERESGLGVLLALRLATRENQYLISIMECLEPESRGVGVICAHVNWKAPERMAQKRVEKTYTGEFDDLLRAKHTLWAQTFRSKEFEAGLTSCALAILANELTTTPDELLEVESIPYSQPPALHIPKPVDEEG